MERVCPMRALTWAVLLATALMTGCSGSSGSATDGGGGAGTVDRDPTPAPQPPGGGSEPTPADPPSVELASASDVVNQGETVQLTWSSQQADSCTASGGWSGSRSTSGTATVGPLDGSTTFTLTCTGAGGNAVAMLSVAVLDVVTLNWVAPTENVDGSALTDLAGYRIYYGDQSRAYTEELAVANPAATEQNVELRSGSYYFAMTALDADGNESSYSNEVVMVVN